MNIYIKKNEMPKSCAECELCIKYALVTTSIERCALGNVKLPIYKNCPLKPLPKCECEKLRKESLYFEERSSKHEQVCEILEQKLAVVERAFKLICNEHQMHGMNYLARATAELKAD